MKRTLVSSAVLALGLAGGGVAVAGPGDGGPGLNGNNNYGLCQAFLAQDKNPNGQSGPFRDLEAEYDEQAGEQGAFRAMCEALVNDGTPGNAGGNGGGNGGAGGNGNGGGGGGNGNGKGGGRGGS